MKKRVALVCFSLLQSISHVSLAHEIGPETYGKGTELALCEPYRHEKLITVKQTKLSEKFPGVEKFIIDEDWRTQGLDSSAFPLSVPLIIDHPISGTTIGVFDRNYNKTFRVASFFGRSEIKIMEQTIGQGRLGVGTRNATGTNNVMSLAILTDKGEYLVINGCDGVFPVNQKVAETLANYPRSRGKAFIMISSFGSTGLRINEIGEETIQAWKIVYKNWNSKNDSINKQIFDY